MRRCYKLVADADVFITNFPLPVRDRLKMAPEHLLPLNPRLIYASFTAYGEAGEEAAKTGFNSTAYWARTGLMDAGAGGCGYPSVAVDARHGRSSQCHRALCRDRHGAVPAGEDRTRRRGEFIAACRTDCGRMAAPCRPACSVRRCRTAAAARTCAERAGQSLPFPRRALVHHGAVQ